MVAVGQRNGVGLIENDGFAGFDCQDASPRFTHRFDRHAAASRHVETHVLLRFGYFDDHKVPGTAEFAGASDGAISTFDGFDGKHSAILDGDALADVEPAHLLGHLPAKGNV